MKSVKILSFILFAFVNSLLMAQNQEITELKNSYYGIKNALVADDGKTAGSQAGKFLAALDAVSKSNLNDEQQKVWKEQSPKLKSTSEAISKTINVEKQREQLNELSAAMFTTLKVFKVNDAPAYYQYCPMKKAYWLSDEKEIKNPYYGKKMLTCGSVKETLK